MENKYFFRKSERTWAHELTSQMGGELMSWSPSVSAALVWTMTGPVCPPKDFLSKATGMKFDTLVDVEATSGVIEHPSQTPDCTLWVGTWAYKLYSNLSFINPFMPAVLKINQNYLVI